MKKIQAAAFGMIVMCSATFVAADAHANAATVFTFVNRFPIDVTTFNPCTGEDVDLTGDFQSVLHVTLDGNGGFHLVSTVMRALSGTGVTTGEAYRGNSTSVSQASGTTGFESSLVQHSRVIALGPESDFTLNETMHVVVDPNGETRVSFDNLSITCQ